MFMIPAIPKIMFEALKILLETYSGKTGRPYWLISAFRFPGLTRQRKSRFQKIIPRLNISMAIPLILFRSLGNWVQMQFKRGIPDTQKHKMGIIIQQTPKTTKFMRKLMTMGDRVNKMAQNRMAFRYPSNLEKGLANMTEMRAGTSAQRRRMELVWVSTFYPWCLRQEKKQMLTVPHMRESERENFMRQAPSMVILALRSAEVIILHIL